MTNTWTDVCVLAARWTAQAQRRRLVIEDAHIRQRLCCYPCSLYDEGHAQYYSDRPDAWPESFLDIDQEIVRTCMADAERRRQADCQRAYDALKNLPEAEREAFLAEAMARLPDNKGK